MEEILEADWQLASAGNLDRGEFSRSGRIDVAGAVKSELETSGEVVDLGDERVSHVFSRTEAPGTPSVDRRAAS